MRWKMSKKIEDKFLDYLKTQYCSDDIDDFIKYGYCERVIDEHEAFIAGFNACITVTQEHVEWWEKVYPEARTSEFNEAMHKLVKHLREVSVMDEVENE
jgi:hypothetical protein